MQARNHYSYERNGDRLVVSRYEANDKTDGVGQHQTSRTVEVLRVE